jgi:hypothetical protein
MFLLVGSPYDPFQNAVLRALTDAGCSACVVENPLAAPYRFSWGLDERVDRFALLREGEGAPEPVVVEGVLLRAPVWLDATGWEPGDHLYAQTETQAALLGWLRALRCPVVNRYPSGVWFRPQVPAVMWQGLLRRAGLRGQETLVTNVPEEARAFAPDGGVYAPVTGGGAYLVGGEDEWAGLARVQERTPTLLTRPHGAPVLAFVVGERVVWDGDAPAGAELDAALVRFSRLVGLAFLELAVAPTADGLRVVAVEPFPAVERAQPRTQSVLAEEVARLLRVPTHRERGLVCSTPAEVLP